jgi:hypothetical protein
VSFVLSSPSYDARIPVFLPSYFCGNVPLTNMEPSATFHMTHSIVKLNNILLGEHFEVWAFGSISHWWSFHAFCGPQKWCLVTFFVHWSYSSGLGTSSLPFPHGSVRPKPMYTQTHPPYSLQPWIWRHHVHPECQQHCPHQHSIKPQEYNQHQQWTTMKYIVSASQQ